MIEYGEVTKTRDDIAVVMFKRRGECDKCQLCRVSNDCTRVEVEVKNTLNINPGDYVSVDMGNKGLRWMSALIYLIPLALVVVGVLIGSILSPLAQGILAVAGLVVGLIIALPIDFCVLRKSQRLVPRMIEVLDGLPEKNK